MSRVMTDHRLRSVDAELARWEEARLLSHDQALRIPPDALWAEILGVAMAGLLLALAVQIDSTRFLTVGGVGLFAFLTMIVMRHLSDQIGVPVALVLSGAVLIGAALLVARLYRAPAPKNREEDPWG